VIKFGAAKDEVIKDLEKNLPMFKLLDDLSAEMEIECTSMSGLIEKIKY
jgi:hypothetical protein